MASDRMVGSAERLPSLAGIFAVSSLVPHLDRYPFLRDADPVRWDFVVSSACIFLAVMQLPMLGLPPEGEGQILGAATASVAKWHSDGPRAVEACRSMFDREYDRLAKGGHPDRYLATDALGTWIFWNLFDRAPSSQSEVEFARSIGVGIVHEFFDYWS